MTKSSAALGTVAVAAIIGLAVFLRPRPTAHDELAAPGSLPPAAVAILRMKMSRHGVQMTNLMREVLLLDDDGVARAAGEIFDEPELARPVLDDDLNALLPERFFTLQSDVRSRARRLVAASVRHDRAAVADEFAALSKSCVACHQVYLFESGLSRHADSAP